MEFDTDWLTLGPHRVRLRSRAGTLFAPTGIKTNG